MSDRTDHVEAAKERNEAEAQSRAERGPARMSQDAAPIAAALRNFWERDTLSFGVPAHQGGRGPRPEAALWAGIEAIRADAPMAHGVDRLDRSWQVQSTAQQLFAEATGADQTLFSTNGSSMSVRVAMMAVAGPGETLLMARNGHKSAFAALVLSGARPVYVDPVYDEEFEIAHGVEVSAMGAALEAHPEAKAAMVFTPSYYGTSADVRALAGACHGRGIPLVTDDAWALDYAFVEHPDLPEGALAQGADLAIGSVHKTLSGFSQTSVLSMRGELVDPERLSLCFELEESTSVSTLMLLGIDGARRQFVREGYELLDRAVRMAKLARERLADEVPELYVVASEELGTRPGVTGVDPTHILIDVASVGLTGYEATHWLLDEHAVAFELMDHRRIMPLITYAHGEEDVERLVVALRDLVDRRGEPGRAPDVRTLPSRAELRTEQAMLPREAFFAQTELVAITEASGRVSAELVTPYPPGIPALAPGEIINEAIVDYFQGTSAAGGFVEGAADPTLRTLRVVR
ncbi:MAG: aminotransferase class I/II-fold pyridoxal phosphate-dependent enzyme [Rubrobacteraceae bacterium]